MRYLTELGHFVAMWNVLIKHTQSQSLWGAWPDSTAIQHSYQCSLLFREHAWTFLSFGLHKSSRQEKAGNSATRMAACVKRQAARVAKRHRCQAQPQCPNPGKKLRRAFSVREEAEACSWTETFSLCSRRQAVLSFGLWFSSNVPEWLPPRVAAVRAWVRVTANPTAHSGCSTYQSVTSARRAESLFHKRGFFWTCHFEFVLQTAGTRNQTPVFLVRLEGKSIFSQGCSHHWPPDFSPWLHF